MKTISVRRFVDQFFIERWGNSQGMYITHEQAHALFEQLGELLGRTFGAQSSPPSGTEKSK